MFKYPKTSKYIYHPQTKTFWKKEEVWQISVPDSIEAENIQEHIEGVLNDPRSYKDECDECRVPVLYEHYKEWDEVAGLAP